MTLARVFQDAALLILGLFAGGIFVFGAWFVGYWESLEPSAFLNRFAANADRIAGSCFLSVPPTLTALGSAAVTRSSGGRARWWPTASAVLTVSLLVVYFVVHAPRNAAFSSAGLTPERVSARWHWVVLGVTAFWTQLVAIRANSPSASV